MNIKKGTRPKPWEIVQVVVILCIKSHRHGEKSLAMGPKTNGSVKGWVMPLGGHIDEDDAGPISAGHREAWEEGSLHPLHSHKVAELRARIMEKRRKIIVHVTKCTAWTGRLRKKGPEFKWLKFVPFSQIPWDKVPTLEDDWMKRVLFKNKKCIVSITCGKDRKDILSISTRTCRKFK